MQRYYDVTALPVLGAPGTPPPLGLPDLMELVRGAADADIVATILLADDLHQRDACLAGEVENPEPAVLTRAQVRGHEPLPEYLDPALHDTAGLVPGDAAWAAYYHHATQVAERSGSAFLRDWIAFEVALRNALAVARARALNLEPGGYIVAAELGDGAAGVAAIVAEWSAAHDPLDGLELLLDARWRWIHEHDAWFTFGADELPAYAARLLLLHRWKKISPPTGGAHHGTADERVKR
jgi:hypothetical protein